MTELIPEGYKFVDGEFVKDSVLIEAQKIEKHVEMTIVDFFSELGLHINRNGVGQERNVDYQYEDIGLDLERVKYISLENMSEMLIYPTIQKEKYSEIYTWLNNRFISNLNETNLLIIIGYSFRDQDVTTIIKEY